MITSPCASSPTASRYADRIPIKLWRTVITTLPEWIAHPTLGYVARGGVVKASGSPFCRLSNATRKKNATEWRGNSNNES
ncbi:hypothetical protein PINS_up016111 [Pythium insidiosum]|nr:hypothetical protein PINS_up016111 [Pythium insidiosum]